MVKFQGLEAYLVRDDMKRVYEHGPSMGERKFHCKGLFDGHSGQAVVYIETAGDESFNIVVKCTDSFNFGNYPDLEVRCLTNTGRVYLGYIAKSSENQIVCLKSSSSLQLKPMDPRILTGPANAKILSERGDGPSISFHIEVRRGQRLLPCQQRRGKDTHTWFQLPITTDGLAESQMRKPLRCTIVGDSQVSLVRKGVIKPFDSSLPTGANSRVIEAPSSSAPTLMRLSAAAESLRRPPQGDVNVRDVTVSNKRPQNKPNFMGGLPLATHTKFTIGHRCNSLPPPSMSMFVEGPYNAARKRRLPESATVDGPPRKRQRLSATAPMRHASLPATGAYEEADGRTYQSTATHTIKHNGTEPSSDIIALDEDHDISTNSMRTESPGNGVAAAKTKRRLSDTQLHQKLQTNSSLSDHLPQPRASSEPAQHFAPQTTNYHEEIVRVPPDAQSSSNAHSLQLDRSEPITSLEQDDDIQFLGSSPVQNVSTNGTHAGARTGQTAEMTLLQLRLAEVRAEREEIAILRQMAEVELLAQRQ